MRKWSYLRIRIQGPCYHPDQIIRFKIDMISNINVYATACHCLALSWSSLPPASSELQLSSSRSIESDSDREWQHSQPSFSIDFGCNHVWPQEEIENLRNHNVQTASCKSLDTAAGWQWPKSCIAPKNTQLAADIWQNCLDKESEVGGEDWLRQDWKEMVMSGVTSGFRGRGWEDAGLAPVQKFLSFIILNSLVAAFLLLFLIGKIIWVSLWRAAIWTKYFQSHLVFNCEQGWHACCGDGSKATLYRGDWS